MKMKKEALKHHLELPTLPFDIASSSSHDLIAVSNIDGEVSFLRYNTARSATRGSPSLGDGNGSIAILDTIQHHTDSCRRVLFSGTSLLSISSDKSLVVSDVTTKGVMRRFENEHALYSLSEVRDGSVFATGDDEGTIKVWDLRKSDEEAMIMKQPEHENFISSLSVDSSGSTLLAASGDGRISVWNSRQRKLIARSDECDSELLTCDVVHGGGKVVCGDGSGVLNIFSWDDWGDISDRSVVQEDVSIDKVMVYSSDVLILGCMDGVIRATSLFPHTPLPHIGDHADNGIEGLCLSPDESDILSIGHDCVVRAWGVDQLEEEIKKLGEESEESGEEEDSGSEEEDRPRKKKKLKHITSDQVKSKQSADFFSDLA